MHQSIKRLQQRPYWRRRAAPPRPLLPIPPGALPQPAAERWLVNFGFTYGGAAFTASSILFAWEATSSWWRGLVPARCADLRALSWHAAFWGWQGSVGFLIGGAATYASSFRRGGGGLHAGQTCAPERVVVHRRLPRQPAQQPQTTNHMRCPVLPPPRNCSCAAAGRRRSGLRAWATWAAPSGSYCQPWRRGWSRATPTTPEPGPAAPARGSLAAARLGLVAAAGAQRATQCSLPPAALLLLCCCLLRFSGWSGDRRGCVTCAASSAGAAPGQAVPRSRRRRHACAACGEGGCRCS